MNVTWTYWTYQIGNIKKKRKIMPKVKIKEDSVSRKERKRIFKSNNVNQT